MLVQRVVRQCISYYIFFSWDMIKCISARQLTQTLSHFPCDRLQLCVVDVPLCKR